MSVRSQHNIKNIVFDLGGVLIDWNPRYLYRKIFKTEEEVEFFITQVCHSEWNEQQDGGRSFRDAIDEATKRHPQYKNEIPLYFERWSEMLAGDISSTVEILNTIHKQNLYQLYALTNWSAETFHHAYDRFDFLKLFRKIVVSGRVKLKKPDPAIFQFLCDDCQIKAKESLFIDDVKKNIEAAQRLGFHAHHYVSSHSLMNYLKSVNVISTV